MLILTQPFHAADQASQVLVSLSISSLGLIAALVVVFSSTTTRGALEATSEAVTATPPVNLPDTQASLKNIQNDADKAESMQMKINHLWKQVVADARQGFYKYEKGNPYWDDSVTFTLEKEACHQSS